MKSYKIEGTVSADISVEQATYINMLVERDIPLAKREEKFKSEGKEYTIHYCPSCDKSIGEHDVFCKSCGQRIDVSDI